jgi:hypothetical protein
MRVALPFQSPPEKELDMSAARSSKNASKLSRSPDHRYRPALESLERRDMPSVAANLATDGVWIRFDDGQLWEHTSAGLRYIDTNVVSVSSGLDSSGAPAAFILHRDNSLWEFSDNIGLVKIDTNVAAMSGSQNYADTVFIQYLNGFVFEHQGVGTSGSFRFVDTNAQAISTGIDSLGEAAVFIRYRNNQVWEWSPIQHFTFVDSNAQSIAASQVRPDTVFITYLNAMLYEHVGTARMPGFTFIATNVSQASAGKTGDLEEVAFFIQNSTVFEWLPQSDTYLAIDGPPNMAVSASPVAISASQNGLDTVFIVYADTTLFEHVGQPGSDTFSLITTNVTP